MDKVDIIKKMVNENPTNGDMWFLLGMEYASIGNKNEAILAFSEALKHCEDDTKIKISSELVKLTIANNSDSTVEITISADGDYCNNTDENEEDEDDEDNSDRIIPFGVVQGGRNSSNSSVFESYTDVTFKDVGGLEELKESIRMKIIKPFMNQGLFSRFKKKIGGGILLFGPPGCGKTFVAKATAGECGANFKSVHITDILSRFLGESEQNVKDIFSTARANKPCVLFFDEIDTIGFNRAKLSSEHMRPVIDQLLTEIEGIDTSTDKLLIIGATNMPWDVDPAFKRPGRFDKTIFVPPPDNEARKIIFKLKMEGRPADDINYDILADKTELYSGADIENVVETATENVISEIMKTGNERTINTKDLLKAIDNTRPSTIEWLKTIKNYVKYANQSGLYDEVESFLSGYKNLRM